jgi:hypothetical protein
VCQSHRYFCQAAFKSFKLAYLEVKLANARPQSVHAANVLDRSRVTMDVIAPY